MELRSAFKIHIVSFCTHRSPEISVILLIITTIGVVSAKPPPGNFCNAKTSEGNNRTLFVKGFQGPGYCNSTEPINWITNAMSQFPVLDANDTALPFGIETKLVTCDTWKMSLSKPTPQENSTVPYYFTSRLIINPTKYESSDRQVDVRMFCGNFAPPTNSNLFPSFFLFKLGRIEEKLEIIIPRSKSTSPGEALSNAVECDESDLTQYQNESNGNCSCPWPKLFHCDNLMDCRFLAHWKSSFVKPKSKKACVVRMVENLCNGTSFSLPDSSRRTGGLLFCESNEQDRAPYILFYPSPQQPNSTNITNATTGNNLTEIQILGNDTETYEQFLILSILSPKYERARTTSSEVVIECKGPAFLFLQGFFWNVNVNSKESKSEVLPNVSISDPRVENSTDGEKIVSSVLTILPGGENVVSSLNVTCEAALSDGNVFITSTRTVKLHVDKPQVTGEITCFKRQLLLYECNATRLGVRWTWFHENSTSYENDLKVLPEKRYLPNCPNETITCTATLPNGVKNSYQFQKEHCKNYALINCKGILPKETTTPNPTTTAVNPDTIILSTASYNSPNQIDTTPTNRPAGTQDRDRESTSFLTIGFIVAAVIFLLAFVFVVYKYVKTRKELRLLTATEIDEFVKGDPGKLKDVEIQGENVHLLPFNKKYEVSDSDYFIDYDKILGSGEFGIVYGGTLRQIPVAIKTTKSNTDVEFFKAFLKEIKVMTFIGQHQNVVQLLGTVTNRIRERIVFIIVELATHESLHSFLREHQNNFVNTLSSSQLLQISPEQMDSAEYLNTPTNGQSAVTTLDLVKWCGQIASGMSHLASKKIIHGDLAARNILLFDDYTAKITDFGLARQLYTSPNYVKKQQSPLPWRIMAPESLKNMQFSTKSDVWSFGVLAWEIFSLAAVPYSGLSWTHDFVDKLEQELRLQKPKWATNDIYENMCTCWHPVANCRPDFEQLEQFYKEMLEHPANESETVYLQLA